MRYLTKEWYNLSQNTWLDFELRAHKGAYQKDEDLYQKLRKKRERSFIKRIYKYYDNIPQGIIEVYGFSRKRFDIKRCKSLFYEEEKRKQSDAINSLPREISSQIADIRLYALGYCTREVLSQVRSLSEKNKRKVNEILANYSRVQEEEKIPKDLRENIIFHDGQVVDCKFSRDLVIHLIECPGHRSNNKITFQDVKIIKKEKTIRGSYWIYEELYIIEDGYEVHILFRCENFQEVHELTLSCKDIIIGG